MALLVFLWILFYNKERRYIEVGIEDGKNERIRYIN